MPNKSSLNLLFVANTISGISQGISMIAIPWYFTVILGFQEEFGLFYGFLTVGSIFWSIYSGVLIDRYDRKNILLIQSFLGIFILGIAAYIGMKNSIPLWLLSGIVFCFTIYVYNIHFMNIYALAQEMTNKENYNAVISKLEVQTQATSIIGGVLAALLLEGSTDGKINFLGFKFLSKFRFDKWELYEIFALDSLTYLIGFILIYFIQFQPISERVIDIESAFERFQTGWNYLKQRPSLVVFGWFSSAVFVCVILVSHFLISPYVKHWLGKGASVFASSELYFAIGAIVSGFTARYFFVSKHEVSRILILFAMATVVFSIFSYNTNLGLFYLANIIFGYSNAAIRFNRISYLWKLVPNELMGRVSSVFGISSYILRAFWGFIFSASIFSGRAGIQYVMLVLLVFIIISGLIIYFFRDKIKKQELSHTKS